MKNLFLILLLLPVWSYSQEDNIPRKTRFIEIHNNQTSSLNHLLVSHTLIHNNIRYEKEDKELGLITTKPKEYKEHAIYYIINVKDSLITISGKYNKSHKNAVFEDIRQMSKLSNNQEGKRAIRQMMTFAKKMGNKFTFRE